MTLADITVAFTAGLLSPLGAACALPLYPGYLSFLAAQHGTPVDEYRIPFIRILLGFIAGAGILTAMLGFGLLVGVIFTLPIGDVLAVVSPIAYAILGGIGILLVLGAGFDLPFRTPDTLKSKSPVRGAFLFGLFFGILILPCNAGPVTVLLALSTSALDFASNLGIFLAYGLGMALPLIALSAVSAYKGNRLVQALTIHHRSINIATGVLMISVAAYYLLVVFRVQDRMFTS